MFGYEWSTVPNGWRFGDAVPSSLCFWPLQSPWEVYELGVTTFDTVQVLERFGCDLECDSFCDAVRDKLVALSRISKLQPVVMVGSRTLQIVTGTMLAVEKPQTRLQKINPVFLKLVNACAMAAPDDEWRPCGPVASQRITHLWSTGDVTPLYITTGPMLARLWELDCFLDKGIILRRAAKSAAYAESIMLCKPASTDIPTPVTVYRLPSAEQGNFFHVDCVMLSGKTVLSCDMNHDSTWFDLVRRLAEQTPHPLCNVALVEGDKVVPRHTWYTNITEQIPSTEDDVKLARTARPDPVEYHRPKPKRKAQAGRAAPVPKKKHGTKQDHPSAKRKTTQVQVLKKPAKK
eukprot:s119_g73.t1